MKKINILFLSSLLAFSATGCGEKTTSQNDIDSWKLSEEKFNEFKTSSIKFESSSVNIFNRDDGTKAEVKLSSKVLFNEDAYSFNEFRENGDLYKSTTYYKDQEGNTILQSLTPTNEIKTDYLVYQSNQEKVKFDNYCNNPFAVLNYEDIIFDETSKYMVIEDKDLAYSFSRRFTFYGETLNSMAFAYNEGNINFYFSGRSSNYSVTMNGIISITDETIAKVEPHKHESYHDEIENAMKEMESATSFTYERIRTNVDDTSDVQTLVTKVTEDAILYPADDFTGYDCSYGFAKYDDGKIRSFEIDENDKVVTGEYEATEVYKPVFNTIAPEFFYKVDENRYELKDLTYSMLTAGNMAETLDEESFVTQYGIISNLFITLKDGHLESFSYILNRLYSDKILLEENVVTIKDVNKTTIPYEFKI